MTVEAEASKRESIIEITNGIIDGALSRRADCVVIRTGLSDPDSVGRQLDVFEFPSDSKAPVKSFPAKLRAAIVSRFKIMANLSISTQRILQNGALQRRMGDVPVQIRVICVPMPEGETIILGLRPSGRPFAVEV